MNQSLSLYTNYTRDLVKHEITKSQQLIWTKKKDAMGADWLTVLITAVKIFQYLLSVWSLESTGQSESVLSSDLTIRPATSHSVSVWLSACWAVGDSLSAWGTSWRTWRSGARSVTSPPGRRKRGAGNTSWGTSSDWRIAGTEIEEITDMPVWWI